MTSKPGMWRTAVGLLVVLSGCGSIRPIGVTPQLGSYDLKQIECPKTEALIFPEAAVDKRGYADPRNIGFTQTGPFNAKTSLRLFTPAAELIDTTLREFLAGCGRLAKQPGEAGCQLKVDLVSLQVTERSGMFMESITANLSLEVELIAVSGGERIARPNVVSEASVDSAVDTTGFATEVVQQALRKSLSDFSRELAICKAGGR